MTVPLLGPLSFSGFTHPWWWFAVAVVIAILGWYVVIQRSRHRRVLRFANMELLDRVAPPARRERLRHLPAVLLTVALVMVCVALAGPAYALRIPRNRAVVMLVIDVSESMIATDVTPNRLTAAKQAGKQFADELTPGINLGLVAFSGTASVLVSPTVNRAVMKAAIDQLQPGERTATGEGIYTALQAIATLGAVMGSGDEAPPARIVLESDGKETIPTNPDDPRGAYPAARAAKQQGVAISTISFGTPDGEVTINGQRVPVPVDDETLQKISDLSGGQTFHAASLSELDRVYADLQQQIGFETVPADASGSWLRLAAIMLAAAVATGLLINRRLPG